jgi:hypothetical protein
LILNLRRDRGGDFGRNFRRRLDKSGLRQLDDDDWRWRRRRRGND